MIGSFRVYISRFIFGRVKVYSCMNSRVNRPDSIKAQDFEGSSGSTGAVIDPYSLHNQQRVDAFCRSIGAPPTALIGPAWEQKKAYVELTIFIDRVKEVCRVLPTLRDDMLSLAQWVLSFRSAMFITKNALCPFNAFRAEHYQFLLDQKRIADAYALEVTVGPISRGTAKQIEYANRIRECAYCCMLVMRMVKFWRIPEEKRVSFNRMANKVFTKLFTVQEARYWVDRAQAFWLYTPGEMYKAIFE